METRKENTSKQAAGPAVLVVMDGGVLQHLSVMGSAVRLPVVFIDYDKEIADDEAVFVPQDTNGGTARAWVSNFLTEPSTADNIETFAQPLAAEVTTTKQVDLEDLPSGAVLVGDQGGLCSVTGDVSHSWAMPGFHAVETEFGVLYLDSDSPVTIRAEVA